MRARKPVATNICMKLVAPDIRGKLEDAPSPQGCASVGQKRRCLEDCWVGKEKKSKKKTGEQETVSEASLRRLGRRAPEGKRLFSIC